jgi:putative ABC transport system ATP-binding protein
MVVQPAVGTLPGIVILLRDVTKTYQTPAGPFGALRHVELEVARGEFVAVVGKSGSGKSTLLNMLGGIDRPTSGSVTIGGTALHELASNGLSAWRGRTVGFVFQFFQLLPTLTSAENVMLPMDFLGKLPSRERRRRAEELLDRVGVASEADKLPFALSGGQQQRVAIARALANDPPLILADEPTGNLDSGTSAEMFALFAGLVDEGRTVVMVTHERDAASAVGRIVNIADGTVGG